MLFTSTIISVGCAAANTVDHLRLKRFKCTVCGYRSNYKSDVQRHIRQRHLHNTPARRGSHTTDVHLVCLSAEEALATPAPTTTTDPAAAAVCLFILHILYVSVSTRFLGIARLCR